MPDHLDAAVPLHVDVDVGIGGFELLLQLCEGDDETPGEEYADAGLLARRGGGTPIGRLSRGVAVRTPDQAERATDRTAASTTIRLGRARDAGLETASDPVRSRSIERSPTPTLLRGKKGLDLAYPAHHLGLLDAFAHQP